MLLFIFRVPHMNVFIPFICHYKQLYSQNIEVHLWHAVMFKETTCKSKVPTPLKHLSPSHYYLLLTLMCKCRISLFSSYLSLSLCVCLGVSPCVMHTYAGV